VIDAVTWAVATPPNKISANDNEANGPPARKILERLLIENMTISSCRYHS
jgi:hypothetical protein